MPIPMTPLLDVCSAEARAHRFMFVSDILQGFSDGIEHDRLNALVEWGRDGSATDTTALQKAFAAPWIAAADEGEWEGDAYEEARKDLIRIAAQAINPLPGAGPMNSKHGACLQKGDRLVGITNLKDQIVTFDHQDARDWVIWVNMPDGTLMDFQVWQFGYLGGPL